MVAAMIVVVVILGRPVLYGTRQGRLSIGKRGHVDLGGGSERRTTPIGGNHQSRPKGYLRSSSSSSGIVVVVVRRGSCCCCCQRPRHPGGIGGGVGPLNITHDRGWMNGQVLVVVVVVIVVMVQ